MHRDMRLRRREEFSAVHRRGRSWANALLVLRVLPNGLARSRVGFSISKRVGKAVVRNQIRRRLREAVRALPPRGGNDVVVIARGPAARADYHRLLASLRALLLAARLLTPVPVAPEGGRPRAVEDV